MAFFFHSRTYKSKINDGVVGETYVIFLICTVVCRIQNNTLVCFPSRKRKVLRKIVSTEVSFENGIVLNLKRNG